jgi:hypothetical protein
MNKNIFIVLILFLYNYASYSQTVGDTIISNNPKNLKLKVYYFHITDRCSACYSIEENLRVALFTHFKKEIKKGLIDLYILNCELPENQKLVKKYNAYGSTLVVTEYKNGKELETEELSAWAFKKSGNKKVFVKELRKKLNDHLRS